MTRQPTQSAARSITALVLFLVLGMVTLPASDLRIMTYNTLNYGEDGTLDNTREPSFRMIIGEIDPDILLVQEIHGNSGFSAFLSDVLNAQSSGYTGTWFDQPETSLDLGVFYKPAVVTILDSGLVDVTDLQGRRDVFEAQFRHNASEMAFFVYSMHLKSSDDASARAERASETAALRAHLDDHPSGTAFFLAGDFNMYDASEDGWNNLTDAGSDQDGRANDPINQAGNWNNNSYYASVHTQNTRANAGGLDDRFDFILVSDEVDNASEVNVVADSYTAFGNDGNHFNQSINDGTNSAVSSDLADALYIASDHLPVYLDVSFEAQASQEESLSGLFISEYSDAVGTGNYIYEFVELFNDNDAARDLSGFTLRQANSTQSFTLPATAVIPASGFLVVGRNAAQQAFETFWNVELGDNVVFINSENDVPLINGGEVYRLEDAGGDNVDPPNDEEFTSVAIGSGDRVYRVSTGNLTTDWVTDDAANATPGSLDADQSLPVSLTEWSLRADARSIRLDWSTAVEVNQLGFEIERAETLIGVPDPILEWQLIASHEQQAELRSAGSSSFHRTYGYSDYEVFTGFRYTYRLVAVSTNGERQTHFLGSIDFNGADELVTPAGTVVRSLYPNPFNPVITLDLLPQPGVSGPLSLAIHDLRGDKIMELYRGRMEILPDRLVWNGLQANGTPAPAGLYLVVLRQKQILETHRVVLLR